MGFDCIVLYMIMVWYYIVDVVIYCNYFDFFQWRVALCKILSQFGADSGFDSDNKHKEIGTEFTYALTPI